MENNIMKQFIKDKDIICLSETKTAVKDDEIFPGYTIICAKNNSLEEATSGVFMASRCLFHTHWVERIKLSQKFAQTQLYG